jgi:hypothetical protein
MRPLVIPLAALAWLAASPAPSASPASSPSPKPGAALTVVCERAPLYVFPPGANLPVRARTFAATIGEHFRLVSGPRTTLESTQYYETDIVVAEPGYAPGAHYWISRDCAIPT